MGGSVVEKAASIETKKNYAREISGNDTGFIYMINKENSAWDERLQSGIYLRWGSRGLKEDPKKVYTCNTPGDVWTDDCKREQSYGLCQIHAPTHKADFKNPKFWNWKWQVKRCYELYKGGTTFYGITRQ